MAEVEVKINVSNSRIRDLLTTAMETSACQEWCRLDKEVMPSNTAAAVVELKYPHIDVPFIGGFLVLTCTEAGAPGQNPRILDFKACVRGLRTMAEKYPQHFSDFMEENDDACTADVWLQCAVFGEVVFG